MFLDTLAFPSPACSSSSSCELLRRAILPVINTATLYQISVSQHSSLECHVPCFGLILHLTFTVVSLDVTSKDICVLPPICCRSSVTNRASLLISSSLILSLLVTSPIRTLLQSLHIQSTYLLFISGLTCTFSCFLCEAYVFCQVQSATTSTGLAPKVENTVRLDDLERHVMNESGTSRKLSKSSLWMKAMSEPSCDRTQIHFS